MKAKKTLIVLGRILFIMVVLWAAAAITDFRLVFGRGEMPVFSLPTQTADDGVSGLYRGLGYYYIIEGNFMPEYELRGITKAQCFLLGKEIKTYIRD